jgi:hypothetical protein
MTAMRLDVYHPHMQGSESRLEPSLSIALKEWAVLCDALLAGEQFVLLRKGGIHEEMGEFRLEHDRFLLFPTQLHQNPTMLKPAWASRIESAPHEPDRIVLSGWAAVSDVLQVRSREQIDRIEDQHIWDRPLIDMRFAYKPTKPLYLLLVRAFRLGSPVTIDNVPMYAGCVSWVPLERGIAIAQSVPAIGDAAWAERRAAMLDRLAGV